MRCKRTSTSTMRSRLSMNRLRPHDAGRCGAQLQDAPLSPACRHILRPAHRVHECRRSSGGARSRTEQGTGNSHCARAADGCGCCASGSLKACCSRLLEGIVGLLMAWGALQWLVHARDDMNRVEAIHIDGMVLAFFAGMVVLCALLSGLIAVFSFGGKNILATLQESSRAHSGGQSRAGLRKVLSERWKSGSRSCCSWERVSCSRAFNGCAQRTSASRQTTCLPCTSHSPQRATRSRCNRLPSLKTSSGACVRCRACRLRVS